MNKQSCFIFCISLPKMLNFVAACKIYLLSVLIKHLSAARFKCDVPEEWFQEESATHRNFDPRGLWENGVVYYLFDSNLTDFDIAETHKAFADFHSKTCIRFEPAPPTETSYVRIIMDESVCGLAQICRRDGESFLKFGARCVEFLGADVIIHELGHTLCYGHEFQRPDRDEYLHYDGCNPDYIPIKDGSDHMIRGHLFDYTSQMNYGCYNCGGGWPTMPGIPVEACGNATGLSVLDADKFNDVYDCGGCLRHRWRRYEDLTEDDMQNMPAFGEDSAGGALYLCRTYVNGEVTPGKYVLDTNICYVGSNTNGVEYEISEKVQIFTLPSTVNYRAIRGPEDGEYTLYTVDSVENFIPVGITPLSETIFAVQAIVSVNEISETAIGKVYASDLTKALVPFAGVEIMVTDFLVIGCQ